ncbi:MAG: NAD(P)-dependent dehydrogenase (short-subunit alcohol dehydrogenase family) [Halieaceae bacterium]
MVLGQVARGARVNVLIVGASGGIGAALSLALCERSGVTAVHGTGLRNTSVFAHEKMHWHCIDVQIESDIQNLVSKLDKLDWLINCVGLLHSQELAPEKSISQVTPESFMCLMSVNTLPTLLLAKHVKPLLLRSPQPLFASISARVGSITDNRLGGWYSYRASKAALNMVIKCLAIEWSRTAPRSVVAALHPGTTDTELSAPFQGNVPNHRLFTPEFTAARLLSVLDSLQPELSGRFWSWDGTELLW